MLMEPDLVWIVETNAGVVGVYGSEDVAKAVHRTDDWEQRWNGQFSDYLHTRLVCWEVTTGVHIDNHRTVTR